MLETEKYQNLIQGLINIPEPKRREEKIDQIVDNLGLSREQIDADFGEVLNRVAKVKVTEFMDKKLKPIHRSLKRSATITWLQTFIPDKKECEKLINGLMVEEQPIKVYTLAQLLEMRKTKQTKYFVSGLFQCGLYLLAGQAKTGKSLVAFHLAISLLRGSTFLGRKSQRCNVLIVQNEEELSSTGEKLVNNGLQELQRLNPVEFDKLVNTHQLMVVKDLDIGVDQEKLLKLVDDHNIQCVVMDSFRASITKTGLTELDLGSAAILYQLQKGFHERGIMGVVVHHANKSDNNSGKTSAFNGVGGSNAILGANDGVIKVMLNSDDRHDGRETLDVHFFPRNDNPSTFKAVYEEGEACFWTFKVLEDQSLSDSKLDLVKRILVLLHEEHTRWLNEIPDQDQPVYGLSTKQITQTLNTNARVVIDVLNLMERGEAIQRYTKDKQWCYAFPVEGSSMWYLVQDELDRIALKEKQDIQDKAILDAILECQTKEEYEALRERLDLSLEDRDRVKSKMTLEHRAKTNLFVNPPVYDVGELVKLRDKSDGESVTIERIEFNPLLAENNNKLNRWSYYVTGQEKPLLHFELERVDAIDVQSSSVEVKTLVAVEDNF